MAPTLLSLKIALGLLMADAIIELSFISNMVAWLHRTASGSFAVRINGTVYNLAGEPLNLLVDQGHTSNGAAGTAFVLIGLGGILALWLRSRPNFRKSRPSVLLYHIWIAVNIPAVLLTITALIYVFAVTNTFAGQTIDADVARLSASAGEKYPRDWWTPQNWFAAVLQLDLVDGDVRNDIAKYHRIMQGWQYNLIPMVIIHLAETVLAFMDFLMRRREKVEYDNVSQGEAKL